MIKTADLNCRACGACCAAEPWAEPGDAYVALEARDLKRLPAHPRRNLLVVGERRRLPILNEDSVEWSLRTRRNRQGRAVCVGLSGSIGGAVSCSLYDVRPDTCRSFKRGSNVCLEARKSEGL